MNLQSVPRGAGNPSPEYGARLVVCKGRKVTIMSSLLYALLIYSTDSSAALEETTSRSPDADAACVANQTVPPAGETISTVPVSPFAAYPEVMTVPEVAEVLRIGRNATYELLRTGEIPHIKLGRSLRVPKPALLQFIQRGSTSPQS
jgi:excisionase family DNA binding protein